MTPVDEALARLDKHEAECALRYEMIQLQLDEHNRRFDKLEKMMQGGFASIAIIITVAIAILEFAR
jgi:hypothetical protein